jgi:hypothetical protein
VDRQQARLALDRFIGSDELSVLALSGNWGVGKTHLLRQYTAAVDLPPGFNGVSYVSCFGVTTVDELRARATVSMKFRKDKDEILGRYQSEAKASLVASDLLSTGVKRALQVMKTGWSGLAAEATYWFVRDALVCLDDIERADQALRVGLIMGFIDELRTKGCKVILVLNREKLLQSDVVDRYWEKVVDVDVKLSPKVSENVALAFGATGLDPKCASWAQEVFEKVSADNIRVHRRAAWLMRQIQAHTSVLSDGLQQYVAQHAALLTWALLDPTAAIPLDVVSSPKYGFMYRTMMKQAGTEQPIGEDAMRWVEATESMGFAPASFDPLLVDLIRTGWCEESALAGVLQSTETEFRKNQASARLKNVLRYYTDRLALDRDTYVKQLRSVLSEEVDYLGVFEFDRGLCDLSRNGDSGGDLVESFIARRGEHLEAVAEAPERNSNPETPRLAAEIAQREKEYAATRYTIDGVAHQIMTGDGWNDGHLKFLALKTPKEFKDWAYSEPPRLRLKVQAILQLRGIGSSLYEKAVRPLELALREIAAENDFQRERIASAYGINPSGKRPDSKGG